MATERVCDRCGARRPKAQTESAGWTALFLGHRILFSITGAQVVDHDLGDLCPDCTEAVKRFVSGRDPDPFIGPPEGEPEPVPDRSIYVQDANGTMHLLEPVSDEPLYRLIAQPDEVATA